MEDAFYQDTVSITTSEINHSGCCLVGREPFLNRNDGMINDRILKNRVAKELKTYKALKAAIINNVINPESEVKFNQITKAMEIALDDDERLILEKKYLGRIPVKDIEIYNDMGLTKYRFYEMKKSAIKQLAIALGII